MNESRSTRIAFDQRFHPAAPVLPVGIGGLDSDSPTTMLRMLVDTGADCSLIPVSVARALRLPLVDKVNMRGVGTETATPVPVHAAQVLIGGTRLVARLMAFQEEALLGRDVLNLLKIELDGPAGWLSFSAPSHRRRK